MLLKAAKLRLVVKEVIAALAVTKHISAVSAEPRVHAANAPLNK
jgi:hypothetical protein